MSDVFDLPTDADDQEIVGLLAVRLRRVIRQKNNNPLDALMDCVVLALQVLDTLDFSPERQENLIVLAVHTVMDETKSPIDKYEETLKPIVTSAIRTLLVVDNGQLRIKQKPIRSCAACLFRRSKKSKTKKD